MRGLRSRRFSSLAALLTFMSVAFAPWAEARTEHRVQGGVGDISNASECPVGNYIVGFRGRTGAWIDQIRIRCAPLLDGGGVGPSKAQAGAGGGGGGDDPGEKCGKGFVVSNIKFYTTNANRQIEYIEFWCQRPDDQAEEGVKHWFGNPNGVQFRRFTQGCEYPEAAMGLKHRWGAHLNAIGLICDVLRRP